MGKMGICSKCSEYKLVQDHHIKGYGEEHKDEVVPYCKSCDMKAHAKARREGRCNLTSEESNQLSKNSYNRRSRKTMDLSYETIGTNVRLRETLIINLNTKDIYIETHFIGSNKEKLKIINENNKGEDNG